MFDKIDFVFDLNGHIIGLALSPDHRYYYMNTLFLIFISTLLIIVYFNIRFLYVNVRPWPPGCVITNPLQPPPIAQEIDIHVIDLVTFQQVGCLMLLFLRILLAILLFFCCATALLQVGTLFRAHRAYTPNDECFFIFLDVSDDYVARYFSWNFSLRANIRNLLLLMGNSSKHLLDLGMILFCTFCFFQFSVQWC